MFFLAEAPASFASSLQKSAAQLTMEAELAALSLASREAAHLSGLLSEKRTADFPLYRIQTRSKKNWNHFSLHPEIRHEVEHKNEV